MATRMGMMFRGPETWQTPPVAAIPAQPLAFGAAGGTLSPAPPMAPVKPGFNDVGGTADKLRRLAGHLMQIGGIDNSGQQLLQEIDGREQQYRQQQLAQQQYQQRRGDEQSDWLAREQFKIAHPSVGVNDTERDAALYDRMLGPGSGKRYLQNQLDPIVNITLPGGRTYVGPRSGIASLAGSGAPAPAPAAANGPAPGTVENGYRFKGGNPADQSSWEPVGGAGSQAPRPFR